MYTVNSELHPSVLLVDSFDPILRSKSQPFNFAEPQVDIRELGKALMKVAHEYGSIVITAPQIGIPLQIALWPVDDILGTFELVFNPRIVFYSAETSTMREGSTNFIGVAAKIKRAKNIRARYQDFEGKVHTKLFDDHLSNAFQQMCDTLEGIIFYERANFLEKQRVLRQWKQICRQNRQKAKQAA